MSTISIPSETKRISIPNTSDLVGNVWYTRNMNLDEEGYIKLSSRAIALLSEKDDSDAGLAVAFGRSGSINGTLTFNVVTNGKAFTINISEIALTATEDGSSPTFNLGSFGRWFRNLWTVSESNDFYTLSGGSYTDRGNLTSGKDHPIEVFRNRDTLCIGDGNTVLQFDNTYSASQTLTLPTDFEVIKLAYSNNLMGVLTVLSDSASGQNQDAFFFVWDGTTATAAQGIPIGSDKGIDVVAYMGSFVVLTRTGQLLFYTGGGFKELASFPLYSQGLVWGTSFERDSFGEIMKVEGSVIHINFNGFLNSSGMRYEKYSQNNPGGVWTYEPRIGLYHRSSPSISKASMITVPTANVNTTTDVLTASAGTLPATGNPIKYTSDKTNLIGGLRTPKVYFIIRHDATQFSLATSRANALAGERIDLTSAGAANNYFLALDVVDFGQAYLNNAGALELVGGRKQMFDHLIMGNELADHESTNLYDTVSMTCPDFENRGYLVIPRITSKNVTDFMQKIFSSYLPLKDEDKIIYKFKNEDLIGLPVSTAQAINTAVNKCTWTSPTVFTTTTDISSAKDAFDAGYELECEIIGGAGSGVMVKITNIAENAGTYTVTVEEDVIGADSGSFSDVIIDNWEVIGTISPDTVEENWEEITGPEGNDSNWFKVKVEYRGSDTSIFDQKIINEVKQML